jgi:hypothetical protein
MVDKKLLVRESFQLWKKIHTNLELRGIELRGFRKGTIEGKTMNVPLPTLVDSLDKQYADFLKAHASNSKEEMKKCLGDLRNVAGCVFLKLKEIEKRPKITERSDLRQ